MKLNRYELLQKAKALLNKGYTDAEISIELSIPKPTISRWLSKEKKLVKAKLLPTIRKEIPELRNQKVSFDTKQTPYELLENGYSIFEYPNNDKIGNYGIKTEPGVFGFSRAMLNIPYINNTPAKRIHQVCSSLYEWITFKGETRAHRRFVPIRNPEPPLYDVKYHDLDTLNATVGIAETEEDKHFTSLDACIISEDFANRFISDIIYQQTILSKEYNVEVGDEVTGGEIYETFFNPVLTKQNEIKLSGKILKILNVKQINVSGEKIKLSLVLVKSQHKLCIGDKLRSLTGLKVIIGDIRKQEKDIIININQIIGKSSTKGSLLKEILLNNSKVAVGMRIDEIIGNNESISRGSSISVTLYPVLKIYDNALLKKIISHNYKGDTYIKQLLKSLHLRINENTGIIELEPETDLPVDLPEHYAEAAHYFWDTDIKINQSHKKIVSLYKEEGVFINKTINKYVWDKLFIPDFILPFYVSGKQIRDNVYINYLNKSWEERDTTGGKGKHPFLVRSRGGESNYKKVIKDVLFPKINISKFLKAIPQHKGMWKIEMGIQDFNDNGYVTIFREPVVDEFSVWSLPVIYNPELPKYCIRIPLEIMYAMNGDTDGDPIVVVPYKSEYFIHKDVTLPALNVPEPQPLTSYEMPYVTDEEFIQHGITHMNYEIKRQRDVRSFGGLRNRIAREIEDVNTHIQLLDYAVHLETILKPEKSRTIGEYDEKVKSVRKAMRDLFPNELRSDKGESSYIVLLAKHGKKEAIDITNLLGFNTHISDFWRDLWI